MRRDGITNYVRDPLTKAALRKIPPTCNHLFNAESLTAALEKAGGVRKAFLPINKHGFNAPASQAGSNKPIYRPSQGQVVRNFSNMPSQGISHGSYASSHIAHVNQPSQGYFNNRPLQGQRLNNADPRPGFSNNYKSSLRPRGRYINATNDLNKGSQKRPAPTSENNSRRKKRKF